MTPCELAVAHKRGTVRLCAVVLLANCFALSGCKTSKDAADAASQMAQTAKALCDYYIAVKTIFEETDAIYQLNHDLYSKPYPPGVQKKLKDNEAEVAKRAELASDFSALAGNLSKLTESTTSADVAASANKLNTEVDTLASVKASSAEQSAIKGAMQALVTAIQEHKEREAARAMDQAVKGLRDLFDKEEDVWNAREQLYTDIASNLANSLVDANATDNLPLLKIALDPFGLAPSTVASDVNATVASDVNAKLAAAAKDQIERKKSDRDEAFQKATNDMSKALHTMAERIEMVANDKAMDFRSTPITVSSVEQWASQFAAK